MPQLSIPELKHIDEDVKKEIDNTVNVFHEHHSRWKTLRATERMLIHGRKPSAVDDVIEGVKDISMKELQNKLNNLENSLDVGDEKGVRSASKELVGSGRKEFGAENQLPLREAIREQARGETASKA